MWTFCFWSCAPWPHVLLVLYRSLSVSLSKACFLFRVPRTFGRGPSDSRTLLSRHIHHAREVGQSGLILILHLFLLYITDLTIHIALADKCHSIWYIFLWLYFLLVFKHFLNKPWCVLKGKIRIIHHIKLFNKKPCWSYVWEKELNYFFNKEFTLTRLVRWFSPNTNMLSKDSYTCTLIAKIIIQNNIYFCMLLFWISA